MQWRIHTPYYVLSVSCHPVQCVTAVMNKDVYCPSHHAGSMPISSHCKHCQEQRGGQPAPGISIILLVSVTGLPEQVTRCPVLHCSATLKCTAQHTVCCTVQCTHRHAARSTVDPQTAATADLEDAVNILPCQHHACSACCALQLCCDSCTQLVQDAKKCSVYIHHTAQLVALHGC